jgi:WD40 repeat protein
MRAPLALASGAASALTSDNRATYHWLRTGCNSLRVSMVLLTAVAMLQDRTLRLWNAVKGLFIKEYRGHGYEVRDVSVCNDNSKMASVGGDRQVRLHQQLARRTP